MSRKAQGIAKARAGVKAEAAPTRGARVKPVKEKPFPPKAAVFTAAAAGKETASKISGNDLPSLRPPLLSQERRDVQAEAPTEQTLPAETPERENTGEAGEESPGATWKPDAKRRLSIDALHDVLLPASLRLGQRALALSGVLAFGSGSPLLFDPPSGHTVELVIADHVVARGRLVIIAGAYGIEVTEILGEDDRLAMLEGVQ